MLNGVEIAAEIKAEVAGDVARMMTSGVVPGLTVILLGTDPASEVYVRNKVRSCGELGIRSTLLTPPQTTTEPELLATHRRPEPRRRGRRHPCATAAAEAH